MSAQLKLLKNTPDETKNQQTVAGKKVKQPVVHYEKISKAYGDLQVLKGIDLDIAPGEKVALIGPSGSGKTTMARLLMTLEEPTSGAIQVDGESLWQQRVKGKMVKANEKHLHKIRNKIGMVFQHFNLFPHMTILGNVTAAPIHVLGMTKDDAEAQAIVMLEKVGLGDKLHGYPAQLSGGQKQRVAIARALVMRPKIMLFDEPTSALDPELVGEVLEVIKEIAQEGEMAMLLITHEMDFAKDVADRVVFFDEGHIIEEGPPREIFHNPQSPRLQNFLSRFRGR
ncbi:ectoine/hydroxyectoine ABC transporter, ATP-binding protein [Desulfitobacterium hafniense DCB-2]|uniref:Ectoine/hydroxyectoine ABC transporter, ATP-binding protein EhuA n=3 Tax=root TaxID=1 RepID=G9XHT4_DESHA|nr:ectoine/hydroxyectoine ABC transporter ATP-binding protein EhuA [Desulfitobacterium hafniense]ACL18813.1 ectoine/hydroxyectoine ABC transporter, ATP-binding protein [Desulfitobacterium hafniense DCB-2]EHL08867.1 ectoine/hydroxyectoine ABC transporter, ATP-binding protein EhuA [Desulfitobacterium hafniense DP7]MEA5024313.1 ectoine/hydroxyectoine ABC transporter ATP-binding protein EhuA [Desulfitobacterium hafniense]